MNRKVGLILKHCVGDDAFPLVGGAEKAPFRVLKYLNLHEAVDVKEVISFEGELVSGESYRHSLISSRLKLYLKTIWQNLFAFRSVSRMFKTCDVVQCHHPHFGLSAAILKKIAFPKKTFIVKAHGTALPELSANAYTGWKQAILYANSVVHLWHDRFVLFSADVVVCSSHFQEREMVSLYRVNPEKLKTIYNGYDEKFFYSVSKKEKGKEICFAFCGRVVPKKGAMYAIALVENLRELGINCSIDLVLGRRRKVEDKGTWKELENIGEIDSKFVRYHFDLDEYDLGELFRRCDIGLVTSKGYESIPSVIYEMKASGLAVFATYLWGIPEVLSERFSLTRNIDEDVKKIVSFIHEADFSVEAQSDSVERYSYKSLVEKYLELYK